MSAAPRSISRSTTLWLDSCSRCATTNFRRTSLPASTTWCRRFLRQAQSRRADIAAACFGCPGPVRDGRLKLTNLPWTLDVARSATLAGYPAHLSDQRSRSQRLWHPGACAGQDFHSACRRPQRRGAPGPDCRRHRTGRGCADLGWQDRIARFRPRAAIAISPRAMTAKSRCSNICAAR